jgi:hypothetical protein
MKTILGYKKTIILSILCLAVLGGYIFLLDLLHSNNRRVSEILSEIASEDEREAALRLIGKNLYDTQKEREVLEGLFVPQEGVVVYIETVERLGREAGVSVEIETLDLEKTSTEMLENISLRLVATGNYSSVRKFLSLMQELPLASEWLRASITSDLEASVSGTWSLSLETRTLKFK